jgi:hypothetical protein
MLTADPNSITQLWRSRGIKDAEVQTHWPLWKNVCSRWLVNVYKFGISNVITHHKILDDILIGV